jgi:hypothetical protein
VDLKDPREPAWTFQIKGTDLHVFDDKNLRLHTAVDLRAHGTRREGKLGGSLDLAGSALPRTLLLQPGVDDPQVAAWSAPPGAPSCPFASWQLDVKVGSGSPLSVGGPAGQGALAPDFYLGGTIGAPQVHGMVQVKGLPVAFPSGALLRADGSLQFNADSPWLPILDLAGEGEVGGHRVRAMAFGAPGQRSLFLSAQPSLDAGQILSLLGAGVAVAGGSDSPAPAAAGTVPIPSGPAADRVRNFLGWGEGDWSPGTDAVGYTWSWR